MYDYDEHTGNNNNDNDNNDNNTNYSESKMDNKFLDGLSKFIQSVESEMDIMLPGPCILTILVILQNN